MEKLTVKTGGAPYEVLIESGCLHKAGTYLNLDRKVLVITDAGVPCEYAKAVCDAAKTAILLVVPEGEGSKSFSTWESLLCTMIENGFTRSDCVVAVGGGVVGDLSGFVAASYMRGIDFYNIPTTVLSQVDSSIGGKTAINAAGIKNIVGAFYPPKKVLVDPDVLRTLPERQIANGLAEAVKMALTFDAELFAAIEAAETVSLPDVIERSLKIKQAVVEADEREAGLRRVLNFGHTIGHGIESCNSVNGERELYHGECVALGMLPMCSESVRARLISVLQKLHLPTACDLDPEKVYAAMLHDKKAGADTITVVTVEEVGSYQMEKVPFDTLRKRLPILL